MQNKKTLHMDDRGANYKTPKWPSIKGILPAWSIYIYFFKSGSVT